MNFKDQRVDNYVKLIYFPIRGRIETARLICEDNNLEYEDVPVKGRDEWAELKPKMMFGQLPCLKDGDLELVQSNAIVRYLARKCDLYGTSEKDMALIDMLNDSQEDLRQKYARMIYDQVAPFEEGRVKFLEDLPNHLEKFEKILGNNNDGTGFFVGNKISFCDYNIFDMLDCLVTLSADSLDKFPKLKAFHERIGTRPNIAKYRATDSFKAKKLNGNGKQ